MESPPGPGLKLQPVEVLFLYPASFSIYALYENLFRIEIQLGEILFSGGKSLILIFRSKIRNSRLEQIENLFQWCMLHIFS